MSLPEPKASRRQHQKRGPSGYSLFSKEQSPIVKAQHPDWTFAEISKYVATLWKGSSETEKKEWQEKAAVMRATIKSEAPSSSAVDDQKGSKKRKRKGSSDEPKPKRALSAYMYFSTQNRAKIKEDHPNASFAEVAALVSAAWNELDEDGKKPYQTMADEDKKRYEAEKRRLVAAT